MEPPPTMTENLEDEQANALTQSISGIAIWMSNLVGAESRRQVLTSALTYLEVIMPTCWTVVYLSSKGHPVWISRAVDGPPNKIPWTSTEFLILGKWARQAAASQQVIIANSPSTPLGPDLSERISGIQYVMPLTVQNQTHGVLVIVDEQHPEQNLTAYEIGLLTVIGNIMALALDRAELARKLRAYPVAERLAKTRLRAKRS